MIASNEELSLKYPNQKIYAFFEKDGGDEWFYGTKEMADNCFGLRINVTEEDVLDFAKSNNSNVTIYLNGKTIKEIK